LEILILSDHYNKKINYAPQSLKNLICGFSYDHEIDNLSQNLNIITLVHDYNKQIKKVPLKIKNIILIDNFIFKNNIESMFKNNYKCKHKVENLSFGQFKSTKINNNFDNKKHEINAEYYFENFKLLCVNKFDKSIYNTKSHKSNINKQQLNNLLEKYKEKNKILIKKYETEKQNFNKKQSKKYNKNYANRSKKDDIRKNKLIKKFF